MPEFVKAYDIPSLDMENNLQEKVGSVVELQGMVLRIRRMSWGSFLVISLPRNCVQCVAETAQVDYDLNSLREGDYISVKGKIVRAKIEDPTIWPRDMELKIQVLELLHGIPEKFPMDLSKKRLDLHLDTKLDTRPVSLRHPLERAVFKISEGACRGFREALFRRGFTELHTPKIVFAGAEGGAGIFSIDYFGRRAFLAQSPQFYKQMGVGIYGRVFETGPVFRAEKHHTSRHVNEYTSLDLEMRLVSGQEEIMGLQVAVLGEMLDYLRQKYYLEIEMLHADIPAIPACVPSVTLEDAHRIVYETLAKDYKNEPDLNPEEERQLCGWSRENYNSEFIFVTHFPNSKRPFYAMDDPDNPELTLSFDLLFRGIEITTGGQRIHDYDMQVQKLRNKGLNPDDFESFLLAHKHGLPPHGGFGMGLERLVGRLLQFENIREATMFPRDVQRLTP